MSMIEQEIIVRVHQLTDEQKQEVLDYLRQINDTGQRVRLSARDLLKLPPDERQRIIEASLALAVDEDFETFEAYSEEDLDDRS
jgi:hypothetical protein